MIRAYKEMRPRLGARVWVDVSAQVIGDVELGDDASVWMNTVVRGDVNRIRVGARTNLQDGCVPEGMVVPPRSVVIGSPAKVRRLVTEEERAGLRRYAERYVGHKDDYRAAEGAA